MPRGRGGTRQGTPGKAYVNRTDMGQNYDMASGIAPAAGGLTPPSASNSAPILPVYPDQTPNLSDPTQRPMEPITAGLPMGAGPGMEAMTNYDPRPTETQALRKWLPLLDPLTSNPETPESVKTLIRYIRGS